MVTSIQHVLVFKKNDNDVIFTKKMLYNFSIERYELRANLDPRAFFLSDRAARV